MEIKNGQKYDSVYGRAAAYFLGTCASEPIGENQKKVYKLITGIYHLFINDVTVIGYKPVSDIAFGPWEKQKGNEKGIKCINDSIKKIESIIIELFEVSETAITIREGGLLPKDKKISRALKKILDAIGISSETYYEQTRINMGQECFQCMKELARISREQGHEKPYLYFSRVVFDIDTNWLGEAFDRLLDADGRLIKLCETLVKRGYKRVDCFDGVHIGLDFIKQYGKKEEPLKSAWGERTHSGISLSYEVLRMEPAFFWLRIPMYKLVLAKAAELPSRVLKFIKVNTKTCDGCHYCIQTDKTGKRPLLSITVEGENKCPLYPGFGMNWRELSDELIENVLEFLDEIHKIMS